MDESKIVGMGYGTRQILVIYFYFFNLDRLLISNTFSTHVYGQCSHSLGKVEMFNNKVDAIHLQDICGLAC